MNETAMLMVSLISGFLLGSFFFGGLWWTIQKGIHSNRPALWFFSSLFIRVGITLSGFFVIAAGHGFRFLICLVGFILARQVIDKKTRAKYVNPSLPLQE